MIISEELKAEIDSMINVKSQKRWTDERIAVLEYLFSLTTNDEIVRIMSERYPEINWTYNVVTSKAHKLGLRREQ